MFLWFLHTSVLLNMAPPMPGIPWSPLFTLPFRHIGCTPLEQLSLCPVIPHLQSNNHVLFISSPLSHLAWLTQSIPDAYLPMSNCVPQGPCGGPHHGVTLQTGASSGDLELRTVTTVKDTVTDLYKMCCGSLVRCVPGAMCTSRSKQ